MLMYGILFCILKVLIMIKGYIWTYMLLDMDLLNEVKNIGLATLSIKQNQTTQIFEAMHFYVEDIQSDPIKMKQAQHLIFDSIPIRLSFRNQNSTLKDYNIFLSTHRQDLDDHKGLAHRYWDYLLNYNRWNHDFAVFAGELLNEYPIYLLEFSGNYISGIIHSDYSLGSMFGCYNFYYVKKGGKRLKILPPEASRYIDLEYSFDKINPKVEDKWDESYVDNIPYYYQFEIHENEIVIFNNCDSMHQFENIDNYGYSPIAYSLRLSNRKRKLYHVGKSNYHLLAKSDEIAHKSTSEIISDDVVYEPEGQFIKIKSTALNDQV